MVRKGIVVILFLLLSSSTGHSVAHVSATPCEGCGAPKPPIQLIVVVP